MSEEPTAKEEAQEEQKALPMFPYEEGQTVRFKYNPNLFLFIVHREFDAKNAKRIYYGRPFEQGKIHPNLMKLFEVEIEGILTPEEEADLNKHFPVPDKCYLDGREIEFKLSESRDMFELWFREEEGADMRHLLFKNTGGES